MGRGEKGQRGREVDGPWMSATKEGKRKFTSSGRGEGGGGCGGLAVIHLQWRDPCPRQQGGRVPRHGGAVEGLQGRVVARLGQQLQAHAGGPLPLGPPVLVPGLDLGVCEVELGGQLLAVLHREVLLFLEAALEGLELVVGEGGPGLPLLPELSLAGVVVRGVLVV